MLRFLRLVVGYVPTALTLAGLLAVGIWGARTGWRLPSPAAEPDDAAKAKPAEAIRVEPGPAKAPAVRARIEFATADDVRRAGLQTEPARTRALTQTVDANGMIGYDPPRYTQLSARAAGTVWWVRKVPGQEVAAGEVLALVESAEVGKAKADLLADLIQLDLRARTLEQQQGAGAGVFPERGLRETRAAADEARGKVLGDRQQLLNLKLPVDPDALRALPADDRWDRVRFLGLPPEALPLVEGKTQSANLLPVVAPFAGAVVRRDVSQGQAVTANQSLFTIADTSRVHLELAIDPKDVDKLRVGQPVFFAPEGGGAEARGVLAHLTPEVDEPTRKVWVHAEADNPGGRLRPNAFGRGRVVVAEVPAAVVVPAEAVQHDGAEALVFVRDGETDFVARRVTPGLSADGWVAVDGLSPGDAVVTAGSRALLAQLLRDKIAGKE